MRSPVQLVTCHKLLSLSVLQLLGSCAVLHLLQAHTHGEEVFKASADGMTAGCRDDACVFRGLPPLTEDSFVDEATLARLFLVSSMMSKDVRVSRTALHSHVLHRLSLATRSLTAWHYAWVAAQQASHSEVASVCSDKAAVSVVLAEHAGCALPVQADVPMAAFSCLVTGHR